MTETVQTRLAALAELRLPDLQARYAEIVGEETRCPNRTFLLRRIAETLGAELPEAPASSDLHTTVAAVDEAPPVPTADAPEVDTVASPSIVETLDGQVVSHAGMEAETEVENAAGAPVPAPPHVEGATDALAHELEIDALRARYVAVVGRSTGSRDKRYLLWKIRLASQGKVPVGPVGRRQPGEPSVEHKVLPLRMPAETVEALDDVWRRRGLKSRMELFRHALDQYLSGLGEAAAAARVRGA
jgi:hypothetical protein